MVRLTFHPIHVLGPVSFPTFAALLLLIAWPAAVRAEDYDSLGTVDLAGLDPVASNTFRCAFHPELPLGYVTLCGEVGYPALEHNGSTVAEFDLRTLEVTRTFEVGLFPTSAAISPEGDELYVVCSTDAELHVIDLEKSTSTAYEIVDTAGVPVVFPLDVSVSPDGDELWVTSNGGAFDGSDENIVIFDRASFDVIGAVTILGGVDRIATTAAGNVIVPVGFPGDVFPSEPVILVYEHAPAGAWKLLDTATIAVSLDGYPAPSDVVVSEGRGVAYVSLFGGDGGVRILDLEENTLSGTLSITGGDASQQGLALTRDGAKLLILEFFDAELLVLDVETGEVDDSTATGELPTHIVTHGGRAWVTEQGTHTLQAFQLPGGYVRGDVNSDGALDISDAIRVLQFLFLGGEMACRDAADIDDDGSLLLTDPLQLLAYLYSGGAEPAYPFPGAGRDFTSDEIEECP